MFKSKKHAIAFTMYNILILMRYLYLNYLGIELFFKDTKDVKIIDNSNKLRLIFSRKDEARKMSPGYFVFLNNCLQSDS